MSVKRRIVVTGLGLVSPCGIGWQAGWEKFCAGVSCLKPLEQDFPGDDPHRLAGAIENFSPGDLIRQKKSLKVMSRDIQLAVAASTLALRDAGIETDRLDLDACGLSMGANAPIHTDLEGLSAGILKGFEGSLFSMRRFGTEGIAALFPLWFLKDIPNMPACHVSIAHGFRGPSNTLVSSAAAGLQAVGEAARVIERGDASVMLAGGTDSALNPLGLSRLEMLGLLGRTQEVRAPFSGVGPGLCPAEGSALLVLEELEHARARGARIYAEVAGYGSASEDAPSCASAARARSMRRALADASCASDELSAVFACGSSIPEQDAAEAEALQSVVAGHVAVTASKSLTGHLLAAAGAADALWACAALFTRFVPSAPGLRNPHPILNLCRSFQLPERGSSILVNASSLSAQHATAVFRQYQNGVL